MIKNKYYEYRKWSFFWGLTLDQQNEVQQVMDEFNSKGWVVRDFEWSGFPKLTLLQVIKVILLTTITLGFCSYWTGFSIIFESSENNSNDNYSPEIKNNIKAGSNFSTLNELRALGVLNENEYQDQMNSLEINKTLTEQLKKIKELLNRAKDEGVITPTFYNEKINKIVTEETNKLKEWQKMKPTISGIPIDITNALPPHLKEQFSQKIIEFSDYYFACKFVLVQSKNKLQFIERDRWDNIIKEGQDSDYTLLYMKS